MLNDPLHNIEKITESTNSYMGAKTKGVFRKYPLTFSLLILFGVTSVLHGFEAVIAQVPVLQDSPILVFIIGLAILIFTGSLYKKIDKKL